jgi:hypothetical protein
MSTSKIPKFLERYRKMSKQNLPRLDHGVVKQQKFKLPPTLTSISKFPSFDYNKQHPMPNLQIYQSRNKIPNLLE